MSTALPTTREPAHGLFTSLLLLFMAILVTGVLLGVIMWWWQIEASAELVTVAVTLVVGIWAIVPRRWVSGRTGRTLLCTMIAAPFVVFLGCMLVAWPRQQAIHKVVEAGGRIRFDYVWKDASLMKLRNGLVLPAWLREIGGDAMFAEIRGIYLKQPMSDAKMAAIDFRIFDKLYLRGEEVTNRGISQLRDQHQLISVRLDQTQINDEGLRVLAQLPNLEALMLNGCPVTDEGLQFLTKLPKISYVSLIATEVTAEGVAELRAALPTCQIRFIPSEW